MKTVTAQIQKCSHCGEDCNNVYYYDDNFFCCAGCKAVYEFLEQNNLCKYYSLNNEPGVKQTSDTSEKRFDFLLDEEIINKLADARNGKITTVTFDVPQMHCSSCIWLLENLSRLNNAITESRSNFLKKKVMITFIEKEISLKEVVLILSRIGYEPRLNLASKSINYENPNKSLYYKIGIAGFCFGNIMLFSFPEYLSAGEYDIEMRYVFGWLNVLFSIPVFFYCCSDYYKASIAALRTGRMNIELPIYLGILVLFIRSIYEVYIGESAGFADSMSGLVFFLLVGRLFQNKTYETLDFSRNYESYFPMSVTVKSEDGEKSIPVKNIKEGDRIVIRHNEIIPADSILFTGEGLIDYSFVTGESETFNKVWGEMIYAGGRQKAGVIELEVIRTVSQSYLTQLWNREVFKKKSKRKSQAFSDVIGKYFAPVTFIIATIAALYWVYTDPSKTINVFTSILVVVCPCVTALAIPFAYGNALRILGKNSLYLKDSAIVEDMAGITDIVFDKTGTITDNNSEGLNFDGELTDGEKSALYSLTSCSLHPLSCKIKNYLREYNAGLVVSDYIEIQGKGIEGNSGKYFIKAGSYKYITGDKRIQKVYNSEVYVSIDGEVKGKFIFGNNYRESFLPLIQKMQKKFNLSLLSGDNDSERSRLSNFFSDMKFSMQPEAKLKYIENLQSGNKNILMLGDGLNDAGALKASNVGIAITDNVTSFSPSCDGIMDSSALDKLSSFLSFSKSCVRVIKASFIFASLYNLFGLYFAAQGELTPLFAAVLMPVSSISVVLFSVLSVNLAAKKEGLL